ncbi:MAG: hypothetical protein RBG13Loki_3594 [Promethearchaeota archaeon CR_4]|nr:MAG: hypothetical protein RBG13Loki_3594 [Candidatus Lokiarchaeota archaeon CR_4]
MPSRKPCQDGIAYFIVPVELVVRAHRRILVESPQGTRSHVIRGTRCNAIDIRVSAQLNSRLHECVVGGDIVHVQNLHAAILLINGHRHIAIGVEDGERAIIQVGVVPRVLECEGVRFVRHLGENQTPIIIRSYILWQQFQVHR